MLKEKTETNKFSNIKQTAHDNIFSIYTNKFNNQPFKM